MNSNRVFKVEQLNQMTRLMNEMECKLAVLDALDRDETAEDCMDLHDQLSTMTHSLHRLTGAVKRARDVCGVDAEYTALFGEAA